MAVALPAYAVAQNLPLSAPEGLYQQAEQDLRPFYGARKNQPLWFASDGQMDPAATKLLHLIATAEIDGIATGTLPVEELGRAVATYQAEPSRQNLARAEFLLSRAFAAYVQAVRSAPRGEMRYEHPVMEPPTASLLDALWAAARAASLSEYIETMGWMHPLYAPLREAVAQGRYGDEAAREAILANLARIRAIPANPGRRYVLVDAAGARLWMYENGRPVDSMKVVVGKADNPTPLMAGYIRYAITNPYWNLPADSVRTKTAPAVLRQGVRYLTVRGYEVLSSWDDNATVIDPKTVDWKAVAAGEFDLRVRQRPRPGNAMGKVKYEFPNPLGIYLHDTPDKNLMDEEARQFSSGCVRLEDADRLGRWLLGGPLEIQPGIPEQRIDLPEPVPVYITYLTAIPSEGQVTFGPDPYNRDDRVRTLLAGTGEAIAAAR